MNKKGFTLVELLGVLIILALLATIISPIVIRTINSSREKAYNIQIQLIEQRAQDWSYEHLDQLSQVNNVYVPLTTLISEGYVEDDEIKNPLTEEAMTGCVKIYYDNNKYKYLYGTACSD